MHGLGGLLPSVPRASVQAGEMQAAVAVISFLILLHAVRAAPPHAPTLIVLGSKKGF